MKKFLVVLSLCLFSLACGGKSEAPAPASAPTAPPPAVTEPAVPAPTTPKKDVVPEVTKEIKTDKTKKEKGVK